jgi:hypothetical protein
MSGSQVGDRFSNNRWEYRGSDDDYCYVTDEQKTGVRRVSVLTRDLRFRLTRQQPNAGYQVGELVRYSQKDFEQRLVQLRSGRHARTAPFTAQGVYVRDFVNEPNFRITSARWEERPEGRVLRVDWSNRVKEAPTRVGTFGFLPDSSWALKDFEFRFPDQKTPDGQIYEGLWASEMLYEGERDGFPLLREIKHWSKGASEKHLRWTDTVEVIEPGPVPAADFTLEAFGVRTAPVAPPPSVVPYLLGLAGLATAFGILVSYLARRARRSSGAAPAV